MFKCNPHTFIQPMMLKMILEFENDIEGKD